MSILNPDDEILFVESEITLEDQIESLELELGKVRSALFEVQAQSDLHLGALKLLIKKCKDGGFNAFPDLTEFNVETMTAEEIIERNKKIKTNRVASEEVLGYPTHEELLEKYKPSPESEAFVNTVLDLFKEK